MVGNSDISCVDLLMVTFSASGKISQPKRCQHAVICDAEFPVDRLDVGMGGVDAMFLRIRDEFLRLPGKNFQ